jgi:hypothetical protein
MNACFTSCGWVLVTIKFQRFEHPKGGSSFLKKVFFLRLWIHGLLQNVCGPSNKIVQIFGGQELDTYKI